MGNKQGTLKNHIETAEKTGALNFQEKNLEKFPPELFKVGHHKCLTLVNAIVLIKESYILALHIAILHRCKILFL